jgi:thermitase
MRRQTRHQSIIKPFSGLTLFCLILWGLGLQSLNVLAYQSDEPTPSPTMDPAATLPPEDASPTFTNTTEATFTVEPAATLPPEEASPTFTNTMEATLTVESPETATSLPTLAASVVPKAPVTPTIAASIPLSVPVLSGEYEADEVLVRFKRAASHEDILQCLSSANGTVLSSIEELNIWVVQVPSGKVAESIAIISMCSKVRYVEPNYVVSIADTIPADPGWRLQYGLVKIHAPQGWDITTGSSSVTIAILDTGVDLGHPDLAAKIVGGYNAINPLMSAQDDNGHGTHAAGIAAAIGNNGVGVAGVSWGARLMPVKILNSAGRGNVDDFAEGVKWAADHGAQVINLSLGSPNSSSVMLDAVNYAYSKGSIIVAAAGNDGGTPLLYPAQYPHVVAVGAVDNVNNHAWFSNYGPELDLVAPGVNIYSTIIGGYAYQSGTSMAVPYVSGLAAILCGYRGCSPDAIASEMEVTALDLGATGFDGFYGFGLIQMDAALVPFIPATQTYTPSVTAAFIQPASTPSLLPISGRPNNPVIPSLISPNTTATSTFTITPAASPTITPTPSMDLTTPEMQVSPTTRQEIQAQSQGSPSWQLPCAGLAFLLAGLFLFWAARRRQ